MHGKIGLGTTEWKLVTECKPPSAFLCVKKEDVLESNLRIIERLS